MPTPPVLFKEMTDPPSTPGPEWGKAAPKARSPRPRPYDGSPTPADRPLLGAAGLTNRDLARLALAVAGGATLAFLVCGPVALLVVHQYLVGAAEAYAAGQRPIMPVMSGSGWIRAF